MNFLPRHAAIYGKVDRIGKADEHINEQGDLVGQWVVKKLHNAEILIGSNKSIRKKYFKISQYNVEQYQYYNINISKYHLEEMMWSRPITESGISTVTKTAITTTSIIVVEFASL